MQGRSPAGGVRGGACPSPRPFVGILYISQIVQGSLSRNCLCFSMELMNVQDAVSTVNIWERISAKKALDRLPQVWPEPEPSQPESDPLSLLPAARHLCPGGDISEDSPPCGEVSAVLRCGCGASPQFLVSGCRGKGCIVCWSRWQHRSVRSAVARVAAYFAYKSHVHQTQLAPRHVVLSPPPLMFTAPRGAPLIEQAKTMRIFRKAAGVVQKGLRLEAAIAVDHCYRFDSFDPYDPDQIDTQLVHIEVKTKKLNRYRRVLDGEWDPLNKLVLSPHRHLIVFGPLPDAVAFYQKTGWVLKIIQDNIPARFWKALDVVPMVEARLRYLLSHAWVWGNGHTLSYFGGLIKHPDYILCKDTAIAPAHCDECGDRLQEWRECEADGSGGVFVRDAITRASAYSICLTQRSPELISAGVHEVIDYLGYVGNDRISQSLSSPPRRVPSGLINLSAGSRLASGLGRFPEWLQVLADQAHLCQSTSIERNQISYLEFQLPCESKKPDIFQEDRWELQDRMNALEQEFHDNQDARGW